MSLVTPTLFGVEDKRKIAIDRLRQFEPPEGYYLAFSGGKDSQCGYHLCVDAGVKFDAHYNWTGIDPPELKKFIQKHYPDVQIHNPIKSIWQLIREKGLPPTRRVKYCCGDLKEKGGSGRVVVTGVRWAESAKRKNSRKMVETCYRDTTKRMVNPIVDWTDEDVWEYIRSKGLPYCELYDQGWDRLGCIGCPAAGTEQMLKEFERYPKHKKAFMDAFEDSYKVTLQPNKRTGKPKKIRFHSAQEVWDWWLGENKKKDDEDQTVMFE